MDILFPMISVYGQDESHLVEIVNDSIHLFLFGYINI